MAATDFASLRDEYDNFLRHEVCITSSFKVSQHVPQKHNIQTLTIHSLLLLSCSYCDLLYCFFIAAKIIAIPIC
ncbi:MAG: hypothetical protein ACI8RD_010564 [Bacillariaceae sp.]|jgi:hypothetical protein